MVERWIAIVGSRDFWDYSFMCRWMHAVMMEYPFKWNIPLTKYEHHRIGIVSGGARGADSLAARYAHDMMLTLHVIEPKWEEYGRKAGMMRNSQIVEKADLVVAFWDGESRGTADTIEKAQLAGKDLKVFFYEKG